MVVSISLFLMGIGFVVRGFVTSLGVFYFSAALAWLPFRPATLAVGKIVPAFFTQYRARVMVCCYVYHKTSELERNSQPCNISAAQRFEGGMLILVPKFVQKQTKLPEDILLLPHPLEFYLDFVYPLLLFLPA